MTLKRVQIYLNILEKVAFVLLLPIQYWFRRGRHQALVGSQDFQRIESREISGFPKAHKWLFPKSMHNISHGMLATGYFCKMTDH